MESQGQQSKSLLDYVIQALDRSLATKYATHSITVYEGQQYVSLDTRYGQRAPAITRGLANDQIKGMYNTNALSKHREQARIPWDDLQSLDSADHILKSLLELYCHIYTNDEHTAYYDPTLSLEPAQPPVRSPTTPVRPDVAISTKPDIAKLVTDQIEADKQWEANHRVKNT